MPCNNMKLNLASVIKNHCMKRYTCESSNSKHLQILSDKHKVAAQLDTTGKPDTYCYIHLV